MTVTEFPRVVWEFFAATNAHDADWLSSLFSERCTVSAFDLPASGLPAVAHWLQTEIVEPLISMRIDEVDCHDTTTTIRCRASDRGLVHDCLIEFRTNGRYIDSLAITATADYPPRKASLARDSRDHHPPPRAGTHT